MTAVGVDWGSAFTRIATWLGWGEQRRVGPGDATGPASSAVTYRGTGICVGEPQRHDPADLVVPGWDLHRAFAAGHRSVVPGLRHGPDEVVAHYFALLLQDAPYSFRRRVADLERAVVAVPHAWFNGDSDAPSRLRSILVDECRIPAATVVSSAVATVAYLVKAAPDALAAGEPLVVCDVGDGTCEVTSFTTGTGLIRPVATATSGADHGPLGTTFDATMLSHATDTATHNAAGAAPAEAVRDARHEQHQRATSVLADYTELPRPADTEAYRVGDRSIPAEAVNLACRSLALEVARLVREVVGSGPAPRLLLTGGLSELVPLRRAISTALHHREGLEPTEVVVPDPSWAVAYGSALIATGGVAMREVLAPAVDIGLHATAGGALHNLWLPAAPACTLSISGTARPDLGRVHVDADTTQIDLRLVAANGTRTEIVVPLVPHPPDGDYTVTVHLGTDGLAVQLDGAASHRYLISSKEVAV